MHRNAKALWLIHDTTTLAVRMRVICSCLQKDVAADSLIVCEYCVVATSECTFECSNCVVALATRRGRQECDAVDHARARSFHLLSDRYARLARACRFTGALLYSWFRAFVCRRVSRGQDKKGGRGRSRHYVATRMRMRRVHAECR
jgi:hypothetical protein